MREPSFSVTENVPHIQKNNPHSMYKVLARPDLLLGTHLDVCIEKAMCLFPILLLNR